MMTLKKISLKESQHASLRILQCFDQFCSINSFKYWIMYGTLIGAIRHGGFIPWDDDIDVGMFRDDYEEMIEKIKNNPQIIEPFSLHHYTIQEYYPHYIARICDDKNYLISSSGKKYKSGVFIDVYPFDDTGNMPQYWEAKRLFFEHIKKGAILSCYEHGLYGSSKAHKIFNVPYTILSRVRGRDYYLSIIDRMSRQFNGSNSGYIGLTGWATHPRQFHIDMFETIQKIPFENIMVNAPQKADEILRIIYGNYMSLPPKEEQRPHHGYDTYQINMD